MSLQAILDAIHAAGDSQVLDIETQAQAHADAILAEAHLKAERIRQDAHGRVVSQATKERVRIIQQARIEALQIVGTVRETLVDDALEVTRSHLAGLRADPLYPDVLRLLIEEALRQLSTSLADTERPQLAADPRDRVLIERILREMALEVTLSADLTCQGGIIARSADGRVVIYNTLEGRLERALQYLRQYFAGQFEAALSANVKGHHDGV